MSACLIVLVVVVALMALCVAWSCCVLRARADRNAPKPEEGNDEP